MNHTRQQREAFAQIKADIMERYKLTGQEYETLLFEIGCEFVHAAFGEDDELCRAVLTEKRYGFWYWWHYKWVMDDALVLRKPILTEFYYEDVKLGMLFSADHHRSLVNHLNENIRHHELPA